MTDESFAGGSATTASQKRLNPLVRVIQDIPLVTVIAILSVLAIRWIGLVLGNHAGLGTTGFDYGLYDQALWLLSQGKAPFVTIMGRNLFGDHTSYILLPFVPLFRLGLDGRVLLIAQAISLAFVGLPIFLLARDRLKKPAVAAALGIVASLHPALGWTNFEQFHPDSFIPLPLAFAVLFASRQQWRRTAIMLVLVALVKEDTVLLTLPLGIFIAWRWNYKRGAQIAMMALGAVIASLVSLRVINGVGSLNGWRIPFGGVSGFIKQSFKQPGDVAQHFLSERRPWYIWQMLSPTALTLFLAPEGLLPLLALLANIVSTFYYQYQIQYHYAGPVVALIWAASIFGLASLKNEKRRNFACALTICVGVWTAYLWGPTPGISRKPAVLASAKGFPGRFALRAAVDTIPKDAVVAVHYAYVPAFGHRSEVYQFPTPFRAIYWGTLKTEGTRLFDRANRVQYIVFPASAINEPEPKKDFASIETEFNLMSEVDGVRVYRRIKPGPTG
jgi:uncharacterized membrane protein